MGRRAREIRPLLLASIVGVAVPLLTIAASFSPTETVAELRLAGEYTQAGTEARKELTVLRDAGAAAWQLEDARRLIRTLDVLAQLPEWAQAKMAEANQLKARYRDAYERCAFAEAKVAAQRRLEIVTTHLGAEHIETAAVLEDLARTHDWDPDSTAAEEMYRQLLELHRRLLGERHPDVATSLAGLAMAREAGGHTNDSKTLLEEALALLQDADGDVRSRRARTLSDLGSVVTTERPAEAAVILREAVALLAELSMSDTPAGARALHRLGQALHLSGGPEEGEKNLQEALATRRRILGDSHVEVAESLSGLAWLAHDSGYLGDARDLSRESLEIRKRLLGNDHPLVADALNDIAVTHMSENKEVLAEPMIREALAIQRSARGDTHPDVAFMTSHLAINLSKQGRYEEAKRFYEESLAILRRIDKDHPEITWVIQYWARDADRRGDLETAEARFKEALDRGRAVLGPDSSWVLRDSLSLASVRAGQGDIPGAERYILDAVRIFEKLRGHTASGLATPATTGESPYLRLALARLEMGRMAQAWDDLERGHARILGDLLVERWGVPTGLETASEDAPVVLAYPLERVQRSLDPQSAMVGWLDNSIRPGMPRFWGYVIRREGPVHWVRLDSPEAKTVADLVTRMSQLRERLSSAGNRSLGIAVDDTGPEARALWSERFAPLSEHLDGIAKLVLIPSESMQGFPVEILQDGAGTMIGERYRVSYAPSASIHAWLHERRSQDPMVRTGLLVGDPPFRKQHLVSPAPRGERSAQPVDRAVFRDALSGDRAALGSLPRLLWSRKEVHLAARSLTDSRVLVGRNASEKVLQDLSANDGLRGYDILHFATHAFIDPVHPECSALILSQIGTTPGDGAPCEALAADGVLTGAEIASWELDANLVSLSGCETGLGRAVTNEGMVGLTYPFFQAGARSLLVSMWKVDDEAAALFMGRFYETWLGGAKQSATAPQMSKDAALQSAKAWLRDYEDKDGRRPFAHPYFWSAFVLIGDPG